MGSNPDGLKAITEADVMRQLAFAAPFLQDALDAGWDNTHSLDDIIDGVLEQRYQLWTSPNAAALTEVLDWPSGQRWVHIFLAGGEMQEILDLEAPCEAFARSIGAVRMTLTGRKGWERVLDHWTVPATTLHRELD